MGTKYNPRIISNGLVCVYDFANSRCYSGSGNTWYNLSSNNYNQIISGIAFTTDNQGLVNLTSGYAYTPLNSAINIDGPISMTFWVKYSDVSGIQSLGITNGTTSPSAGMQIGLRAGTIGTVWKYGGTALLNYSNPVVSTWYHYGLTLASSFMSVYINGALNVSGSVAPQSGAVTSLIFGDYKTDGTGAEKIKGYIGNFQLYNRVLTAQEILQNYNATKMRYL